MFTILEVGGRVAAGSRIMGKAVDCNHFDGSASGREGGGLAPESSEMHKTVIIFMVLEVGGRGAAGFRIIRNA